MLRQAESLMYQRHSWSHVYAWIFIWCYVFPVADVFRVRAHRFPALIISTVIYLFRAWPLDAFSAGSPTPEIKSVLSGLMAEEHLSVKWLRDTDNTWYLKAASVKLLLNQFWNLLDANYLLCVKRSFVMRVIGRLDAGLSTLRKTFADVAELQIDLKHRFELMCRMLFFCIHGNWECWYCLSCSATINVEADTETDFLSGRLNEQGWQLFLIVYIRVCQRLKLLSNPPAGVDLKWDRPKLSNQPSQQMPLRVSQPKPSISLQYESQYRGLCPKKPLPLYLG